MAVDREIEAPQSIASQTVSPALQNLGEKKEEQHFFSFWFCFLPPPKDRNAPSRREQSAGKCCGSSHQLFHRSAARSHCSFCRLPAPRRADRPFPERILRTETKIRVSTAFFLLKPCASLASSLCRTCKTPLRLRLRDECQCQCKGRDRAPSATPKWPAHNR